MAKKGIATPKITGRRRSPVAKVLDSVRKAEEAGSATVAVPETQGTRGSADADPLSTLFGAADKRFGKGAIMRLTGRSTLDVAVVPTGNPKIDAMLGVGGLPIGRVIEVYGPESAGKTTLSLYFLAAAQRAGFECGMVDVEHALDPAYARTIGVDLDKLLISQPDCGEDALEIVDMMVQGGVRFVVLDSVAALVPRAELEGDMGDTHMGLQARLMSQAMRKLTGHVSRANAIVLFVNQIRQKIGVMYGPNTVTTGGNALKFYASVRMEIKKIGVLREGSGDSGPVIGIRAKVTAVKNKVAPPFKTCEIRLAHAWGVDTVGDVFEMAVAQGVVELAGGWYSFGELKWHGKENAILALRADKKLVKKITRKLT